MQGFMNHATDIEPLKTAQIHNLEGQKLIKGKK
jgi:hypothetical protein